MKIIIQKNWNSQNWFNFDLFKNINNIYNFYEPIFNNQDLYDSINEISVNNNIDINSLNPNNFNCYFFLILIFLIIIEYLINKKKIFSFSFKIKN